MLGATAARTLLRRKWDPNSATLRWFSSSHSPMDMAARDGELRIFLVAGEVSGDSIASRLMASLKLLSLLPVRFAGLGGPKMSSEGLRSLFPIEDISVMGIWELLPHLYRIRVRLNETVEAAALFEPHVVLTVDSKGFSFRFLKQLRGTTTNESALLEKLLHFCYLEIYCMQMGECRLQLDTINKSCIRGTLSLCSAIVLGMERR